MPLPDLSNQTLLWTQPHLMRYEYQLRRGGESIGTLTFRSAMGSLATAENPAGRWTFKRQGFLQTRVSIRAADSEDELATFRNNTWSGGGTLEFPDGRHFRASTNFWHTRYEIMDATEQPLLRYRTEGFLRMSGQMEVLGSAAKTPELPWLMMLGWYLAVMMHRDSVSAAGAM
jgi:hypothetical protein